MEYRISGTFTNHLRAAGLASRLFDTIPTVKDVTIRRIGQTAYDARMLLEVTVVGATPAMTMLDVDKVRAEIAKWSKWI